MSQRKAIENVVRKVVGEAEGEVKALLDEELKRSLEVLEVAEREAMMEVEKITEAKDRQAEVIRRRAIGSAEMAVRNRALEFIEEAVKNVFQRVFEELEKITSTDGYRRALKRFIEEGVDAIPSRELVVLSNERDHKLLKGLIEEVSKERDVKMMLGSDGIKCTGGVQVRTPDGVVLYDNTFEGRLERLKSLLRRDLASLFMKRG